MATDPHQPLRDDVRLLGELLGETLRAREGDRLYERVEEIRAMAKRAHAGQEEEFARLADRLRELPLEAAVPIARAFAHFLTLANIAEQHHRVRRRRDYARDAAHRPQPGSCDEVFPRLVKAGIAPDTLRRAIDGLRVELVLTAHPTEIVRRTLLQSHRRIADTLALRDRPDLTPAEADESVDTLRREVATAWQTEEVRGQAVTPLDEVRAGLAVFEHTLWDALPRYLRSLDRALRASTGTALPLDAAPMRIGSWIGGDRDGNPNVTPAVTRQATWLARWTAADLYLSDINALRAELSLTTASEELRAAVPEAREPYRALLRGVAARLRATRKWAQEQLDRSPEGLRHDQLAEVAQGFLGAEALAEAASPANPNVAQGFSPAKPYLDVDDFAAPLRLCYGSLTETGNGLIAAGRLTDILRRVAAFGLTLARLDLRQESARHTEAVDWIARARGLGAYADASEDDRIALLVRALSQDATRIGDLPLIRASDVVRDVIETFQMAATLHPDSLGAYVITMASRASDVLAVEWLQQLAGNRHPQRVVPLFETAGDLERAGATLDQLLAIPWYRARIGCPPSPRDADAASASLAPATERSPLAGARQEVMVGYSDSAKDAGRFAAAWALYKAQEEIVAACARRDVAVTLFHGRGGSIGRGGGPTYLALQSQPPGSVDGTIRVTEQGEVIQAQLGLPDIAVRTLEVYTTATLEATLTPATAPAAEWRAMMDRLFERSRAAYRGVVYEHPRFVEYFRVATPEPELRAIHLGSRPATRARGSGVDSLRAIPWQFAWTQTRLLLASWLGVEDALDEALARGEGDALRAMYERWPFFRSTLDLIEMVLAKADARIAAEYDRRLVPPDLQPLGRELRARLARAATAILAVTGHRELAGTNRVLRRGIDVRNPYVDPINLVQVELLARLRRAPDAPEVARAFRLTVNGIAAGMQNTG